MHFCDVLEAAFHGFGFILDTLSCLADELVADCVAGKLNIEHHVLDVLVAQNRP